MPPLSPQETKDLAENDPDLLEEAQAEEDRELELLWPEPSENEVRAFYDRMRKVWGAHKAQMAMHRKVRYLRDQTPEKWRRHLEDRQRVRTRLSHNEVLRTSANQARNAYKVECRAAGTEPTAVKRAKKQTRWASEFWPAMERASLFPLRRRFVDAQNGDGMGVYEVYVTHRYDAVNTEEKEIEEPGEDGKPVVRKETPKEYLQRTESELLQLGECAEIGVRWVDPMAVFPEPDDGERVSPASHGISRVIIAERKMYRDVYRGLLKRKGAKATEELQLPSPGSMGWPANYETWGVLSGTEDVDGDGTVGVVPNDASGEVEHLRYYDPVWYVEIVGGKVVTCEKHGLPGVPVFVGWCIVTGSSFLSEALEGITWGMTDIELAANDLLTYKIDSTITFGRPAPVIQTPMGASRMEDARTKKPVELDFSDVSKVKQLAPGQTVADAFEGFRGRIQDGDISALLGLWQQNGLNPIAQGQSPGASPAGYTVNSLMGASLAPYDQPIENEEKVAGQVIDFVRLMIRDTIKERLYLAVPMEDKKVGGTEWLGLGPDDVDETPCRVTIDPLSDANRMAMRESLHAGRVAGYISRSRVQREGYNVEDTEAEDLEIIEDSAMEKLASVLLENVFQRVRIAPPAPPAGPPGPGSGMKGQRGAVEDASGGAAGDAAMADPNPPTVGRELAASSQLTRGGKAGQGNGYQPPAGVLNRTA